jgi:hypothetical protein
MYPVHGPCVAALAAPGFHRGDAQKAAPFVHPSCQTLGVRSTKPCKPSSSKQRSCGSSESVPMPAHPQRFGPLLLNRCRGLSVLRRPAHRGLGSAAASNTLSFRVALQAFSASQRLTIRASGTASPPLRSNVRRLYSESRNHPRMKSSPTKSSKSLCSA